MIGMHHTRSKDVAAPHLRLHFRRTRMGAQLHSVSARGEGNLCSVSPSFRHGAGRVNDDRVPPFFPAGRRRCISLQRGAAPKKIVTPIAAGAVAGVPPAIIDPARSIPGERIVFLNSGGDDDDRTAYRGTAGGAQRQRRSGGAQADRGGTGGGIAAARRTRRQADSSLTIGKANSGRSVDAALLPLPFRCSLRGAGGGAQAGIADRSSFAAKSRKGAEKCHSGRRRDKRGDGACPSCGWFYVTFCAVASGGVPSLPSNYPAISIVDAPSLADFRREARP